MSFFGFGQQKRELPTNTHGNLPEMVTPEEQGHYRLVTFVENPPLLTETQIAEQLGADKVNHDPFYFLSSVASVPCLKRSLVLAGGTTTAAYLLTYLKVNNSTRAGIVGSGVGLFVFVSSWLTCRISYHKKKAYENQLSLPKVLPQDK